MMLLRFSLYGFLKNQRYFEPFLVLVLLEKGLSFFVIGLLIAFREVTVNAFELPSGAIADVYGRRRSMILSFTAYIASFLVFGLAQHVGLFFLAMFFFAIGEAFRTGTHKAMIFTWLRLENRIDERTKVYGYTRSWSKFGSAVSVVLATGFVFASDSYTYVFYFAIIPYVLGVINFLGYPRELDGEGKGSGSLGKVFRHLREALRVSWRGPHLRRLVLESMGFEGVFHSVKDYLQPVLQAVVVASVAVPAVMAGLTETRQTSLLVGPVYFVLYLLSAVASRQAHRVADRAGGEDRAARRLWGGTVVLFAALVVAACFEVLAVVIVAFLVLHVVQNLWRPILISRFDTYGSESQGATVLSIESQARRGATMVAAPMLGLAVDLVRGHELGGAFWPVGALGVVVSLGFFLTAPARDSPSP